MRHQPGVLIVEDEPAIAELIAVNLRHNGFRPTWAMDSALAQCEIDAVLPDVILLDWMLPGESGLVLARRWRANARTKDVPIIMLTARGDELDRVAGLDAGADDYMGGLVVIGDLALDGSTYRVSFKDQMLKLGPTEFKLLHYFMNHAERVHSRSQLLDKVWGDHVFIEERTVDVHVKRLREALGAGAGQMIETVRGAGYRLTAQITSTLPSKANA